MNTAVLFESGIAPFLWTDSAIQSATFTRPLVVSFHWYEINLNPLIQCDRDL